MLETPAIVGHRARVRDEHINAPYYDNAEDPDWLKPFWEEGGLFRPLFEQLDLTSVIELACGHGRHAAQIIGRVGSIALVDINESNIVFCQERFAGHGNVSYAVNGGNTLPLESGSCTSLFCYDAMVHFEAMDVIAYVFDAFRVLQPGGRALLHYSVDERNPEGSFAHHVSWRNYFSESLMRHAAARAGFRILERRTFAWPPGTDGVPVDGLILLEKP